MMNITKKSRDFLFDNYKTLLIFLVVVGHFVGPSTRSNDFLLVLKWFIVSFHMPAFVFISGYFSKKDLPLLTIFQRLAVPYIVCEIIYYLLYTVVLHKKTGLLFLEPKFTLWYLLALCFWRILTPYIKKIPHHMILAVIAGLLIGFSNMDDGLLTIPRALVFYPFYLAGTSFERGTLTRLRSKKGKISSIICVAIIFLFLMFLALQGKVPMQVFYGRYNYAFLKQGMLEGLLWRIGMYIIGFILTFAIMILMPEKKIFCSYIGTRTMAVYLFHGLTYTYLNQSTSLLKSLNTPGETLLILAACVGLTALFSLKPFTIFTNSISSLKFPHKKGTA